MSPRKMLIGQLGLCWLLLSAVAQADPLLSGIAVHKELGQEQFLGALYAEVLSSDVNVILDERVAKRMELKILAPEGIAPRRFTRSWIEGAAINIPAMTMSMQADNMLAFDHFFRGRLEVNDHLVFEFTPEQGTAVSLNASLLGVIEDVEFFGVLLRTWVGRVPLSSGYRDALLNMGVVDAQLLQRYRSTEPHPSRIAIANTWLDVTPEPDQSEVPLVVAANNSVTRTLVPAEPTVVPEPIKSAAVEPVLPLLPSAQIPVITQPIAATTDAEPDVDDGPSQLTTQTLVAQQFYISEVMNRIYSKVVYPRRARELQQFGSVKMRVVIDARGNITALQPIEMSDYSLLNKAVESAIKDSAPFPPLPSNLAAQDLEFSVPVIFALGQS